MSLPVVAHCISIDGDSILQGTDNIFKSLGAPPEEITFLSIKIFLGVTQSSSSSPTSCSASATELREESTEQMQEYSVPLT